MKIIFDSEKLEILTTKGLIHFFEILHNAKINEISTIKKVEVTEVSNLQQITKIFFTTGAKYKRKNITKLWAYESNHAKDFSCSNSGVKQIFEF